MWLPHALRIIREEAPGVEIMLSSQSSPELTAALMRGKLDLALLRRETQTTGLSFRYLAKEPLIVILPADHRLASRKKFGRRPVDATSDIAADRFSASYSALSVIPTLAA
jgi:LysR family hca operon transcriptional activator